jgi:mono/diheme cytochrome c family protein
VPTPRRVPELSGRFPGQRIKMLKISKYIVIIGASVLMYAGCASARRTEPIKEPIKITDKKLLSGQQNFYRYCSSCHPHGEAGLAPALNNKGIVPGFLIKFQVRNGLGKMPSFPQEVISPEQLDDIVDYIKFLQSRD